MSKPNLSYYQNEQDKTQVVCIPFFFDLLFSTLIGEHLLKDLTLYKLYEKLDMKLNNQSTSEACNVCESQIKVASDSKHRLVKLCKDVCSIMLNIDNIGITCSESSCLNLCNYMKFWIYEHLMKITTAESEVKSFYKPLVSIMKLHVAKLDVCYINFYMNNEVFKIFKHIYDFLYTYKDMKDDISQKYYTKGKIYCNHVKEFVQYYNSIKGSCTDGQKCKYHDLTVIFKNMFTSEGQLDYIYKNCKYEKTACPSGTKEEEEIPCLKDKEYKSIFPMQFDDKNNVISIISNIAIFIIPIFGLLSIFYKFTPLGFWLRSRMRKKNNTHKNMSQGKYDILENTSRTEQLYPESKEYNLRYQ
ncbi:VIR protein [Plasmodium vivax]|uniref:VIR protein n=1 Tax=Plasmodium vivax TaxID=5855 RepID=A0A1G4E3K4_PLAVI|nr:VIR protein [Plasmodium vivax]